MIEMQILNGDVVSVEGVFSVVIEPCSLRDNSPFEVLTISEIN